MDEQNQELMQKMKFYLANELTFEQWQNQLP